MPAAARGSRFATPTVEAWARWAVPKASFTYSSASAASSEAKGVVVLFFFGVEAQVLEKQGAARRQALGARGGVGPYAVRRERDLLAEQLAQPPGDGSQAEPRLR
jgi:hypothetical protein